GAEEGMTVMQDLASPVGAFVREKCVLDPNAEVSVDTLYATYKDWCQSCEYPKSDKARFGRDLRAACPSVKKTRPRDESTRHHVYRGIRLRTPNDGAEQEAGGEAEQELPFRGTDNAPVTVTTMTSGGGGSRSGHGGHGDQDIVAPTKDGSGKSAREREKATYRRSRSDDLPYTGPVVAVPDLPPDSLDEHGVVLGARPAPEPGLSERRIRELA